MLLLNKALNSSLSLTYNLDNKDNIIKLYTNLDNSSKEIILTIKLPPKAIDYLSEVVDMSSKALKSALDVADMPAKAIDVSKSWVNGWLNTERSIFNDNIIKDPLGVGVFNKTWTPKMSNGLNKTHSLDSSSYIDSYNLPFHHFEFNGMLPLFKYTANYLHSHPHFVAGGVLLFIIHIINSDTLKDLKSELERLSAHYWHSFLVRLEIAITFYNYIVELILELLAKVRAIFNHISRINSTMFRAQIVGQWPAVTRTRTGNVIHLFANPKILSSQSFLVHDRLIKKLTHLWIELYLYRLFISVLLRLFIQPLESYITIRTFSINTIDRVYARLTWDMQSISWDIENLVQSNHIPGPSTYHTDENLYAFNLYTFRFISNSTVPFFSDGHYGDSNYQLNNVYDHVMLNDWHDYLNNWNIYNYPGLVCGVLSLYFYVT